MIALQNLGNLYRYQGDYDQATRFYERSLSLSGEYGGSWNTSNGLWYLGLVALHRNDYQQARQQFIDYYHLAREVYSGGIGECDFLTGMAAVAGGTNHLKRAAKLNGAAQALFETTDYRFQTFDRAEFDRHIRIAQEQLGGAKFEELTSEGYAMTMEQAIAYALELSTDQ
jgi:tetratricopeptide (TPR) repeat protein